jgi:single-stranded-DNA-specific exonuclease
MTPHWRTRHHDPEQTQALSREADVHPLIARLLLNRGVKDADGARGFLDAKQKALLDPECVPGVVEAAERICKAIERGTKIVIYGDYDVDGVCATSVLWACLKLAGAKSLEYYVPHRVEEGYGLNAEAIKTIAQGGAGLIVTVDCGITAVGEAKLARDLGVELIITDHHAFGPDLPEAAVLVHPQLGHPASYSDLCGCGVAFKLAWQICKSFGDGKKASPAMRDFLLRSLNLVALATVADVMPLEGENRIFVKHGLRGIAADPSVGLRALMEVAGVLGRDKLNSGVIGFNLAPRINAAGRMERAMAAVEMLITTDEARARELAQSLNECNVRRQEVERRMVAEAHRLIEEQGGSTELGAIVLGSADWHTGVVGIVAGRIAETYHRPTIILAVSDHLAQGSARSIPGFHLVDAIRAGGDGLLIGFGGHAAAAGLKLHPDNLPAFTARFNDHCRSALTTEQLRKDLWIDAEVRLAELTTKVVQDLERLEPFGMGNPRPVLSADRVRIVGDPRYVGADQQHIQLKFSQGTTATKAIGFRMASRLRDVKPGTLCSVAFHPSINEWNGRREVQLELKDVQVHEGAGDGSTI